MPTAAPAEVEAAVVECLRVAAPGGGHILATDHSFHEGIPIENVLAFIAAGIRHGSYA
jgi:uroporphyrinogen decarboxylase